VCRVKHNGTAADAASTLSVNYESGGPDAINANSIELRWYAAGARTVNAGNPLTVTLFFFKAVK